MGVKKYIKKQKKRLVGYAKKRYAPNGKLDVNQVVKDVLYVKSVLNVERKFLDKNVNVTTPLLGANWEIHRLNDVPLGSGESAREGSSLRVKSLQINGKVECLASTVSTNPSRRVRVVLFMDRETNIYNAGTLPTCNELYTGNNVSDMRSWESIKGKRFKILKVFWIKVDDNNSLERWFRFYQKMHMPTKYLSSDTTGTGIIQNPLYLAFSSDATIGSDLGISFTSRITYVDN